MNNLIRAEFPADPIVGEEDSKDLRENAETREKVVELANSVLDSPLSSDEVKLMHPAAPIHKT